MRRAEGDESRRHGLGSLCIARLGTQSAAREAKGISQIGAGVTHARDTGGTLS